MEFPNIKNYMDSTIAFAKENGFVETIFKRKKDSCQILIVATLL